MKFTGTYLRGIAATSLQLNNIEMSFLNLHEKHVVGKVLEYIQPFSLGIHRNVAGQMVASCPGSLITKCANQTGLQIMVCVPYFIGIIVCVLLVGGFFFFSP